MGADAAANGLTSGSRSELDILVEWYEYNSFVRKKYLRAIFGMIPKKERYADRGTSFPSIVDLFVHVLNAYRFWFQHVYPVNTVPDFKRFVGGAQANVTDLIRGNEETDKIVFQVLRSLKDSDLDMQLSAEGRKWGSSTKLDLRQMLYRVIEEELQHRGEMNAIFWQMNLNPPVTEWMEWVSAVAHETGDQKEGKS